MKRFGIAATQMVEILKAIARDAPIVLMDESTTALSARDNKHHFRIIATLWAKGAMMHDGLISRHAPTVKCTEWRTIVNMVGHELCDLFLGRCIPPANGGVPIRHLRGLEVRGSDTRVSFTPCRNEILGLGGPFSTDRSDVLRSLLGIWRAVGERLLDSRPLPLGNRPEVVRGGIALAQADRKAVDAPTTMPALDNVTLPHLDAFAGLHGIIDNARRSRTARYVLRHVRPNHWWPDLRVAPLSGGNQQIGALPQWPITQST
jgi:ABC-type sugar transport system ATPase subunit